jgi:SAM-dependent methyltransferase
MRDETPPPAASPALVTRDLNRCLLCGSADLRPAHFAYAFEGVQFPGVTCAACTLTFLSRQPGGAMLPRMYSADYFEADYHCGHESQSYFDSDAGQTASAQVLLRWIEAVVPKGRLLEVGCAGGYFLQAARERGFRPFGVEISKTASRFARESLGLEVRTGTLEAAGFDSESFDAAYMGDVLEHVPDPMRTLHELARILRPGGALLIAGPITVNSIDRRLGLALYRRLGRTKTLRQPPYHLIEFTPRTLRDALKRAGFDVRWLRENKIPPAWRNPRHRALSEHVAKLALDVPNWILTSLSGKLGDRVALLAVKRT